jgi:hypothetical protein
MSIENPNSETNPSNNFFGRVIDNDATKKGVAAAVAGVIVAVVCETFWPSR